MRRLDKYDYLIFFCYGQILSSDLKSLCMGWVCHNTVIVRVAVKITKQA